MKFTRHPLSFAFGQMSADEESELKASIAAIGCLDSRITLLDGQVLDGWHRYKFCDELGQPYTANQLPPGMDPQAYVIAKNHHRRHQNASQRALAVAAVYAWKAPWRPTIDHKSAPGADLTEGQKCPKTASELAAIADVSTRTMEQAKVVVTKGAPEVIEAVKDGVVSLKQAAELVAAVPKKEQVVALIDPASESAAPIAEKKEKRTVKAGDLSDDGRTKLIEELQAKVAAQSDEVAGYIERMAEAAELLEEMRGELETANKIIEADPGVERIKAAQAEATRFRTAYRAQEDRVRGLMGEANEAKRIAKMWERRAGKATH